jgi:hypothetical protein
MLGAIARHSFLLERPPVFVVTAGVAGTSSSMAG